MIYVNNISHINNMSYVVNKTYVNHFYESVKIKQFCSQYIRMNLRHKNTKYIL